MRFGEVLNAKMTPEWCSRYFSYQRAHDMLSAHRVARTAAGSENIKELDAKFKQDFITFSEQELDKINKFFAEKVAEARKQLDDLCIKLDEFLDREQQNHDENEQTDFSQSYGTFPNRTSANTARLVNDFEFAFSEFYLGLILLQNYQQLNLTAFRKILKKLDKMLATGSGNSWREEIVLKSSFAICQDVDDMIVTVENEVTMRLEGGDRKRAMNRLRVPPLDQPRHSSWTVFRIGLWCGGLVALLAIVTALVPWSLCSASNVGCWRDSCTPSANATNYFPDDVPEFWEVTIRVNRGVFLLALMIFLLGINFHGWAASGINHVLIFELDPRNHLSSLHLIEAGFCLLVLSSVSLIVWLMQFYLAYVFDIDPVVFRYAAFAFLLLLLLLLLNPIPIFAHSSRFWLLKVLFRIVTAPFHEVRFADFWLADQFTSLVPVFQDFVFVVCCCSLQFRLGDVEHSCDKNLFILTNIIGCLPAWFRFAQCLRRFYDTRLAHPHLTNAGKYSTTFFVVLFRSLHASWDSGDIGPPRTTTPMSLNQTTSSYSPTTPRVDHSFDIDNPYLYLWIFSGTVSSIYTYWWDVRMDWGLFDKNAGANRFLRETIIFQRRWYYYLAIGLDLILRFCWTLTVTNFRISKEPYITDLFVTTLTFIEMFRRFVWNFFRLEYEHINNVNEFRAIRDITIKSVQDSGGQSNGTGTGNGVLKKRLSSWWRNLKTRAQSGSNNKADDMAGIIYDSQADEASLVTRRPTVDDFYLLTEEDTIATDRQVNVRVHESFARSRIESVAAHSINSSINNN